jgi:hypothetical protein
MKVPRRLWSAGGSLKEVIPAIWKAKKLRKKARAVMSVGDWSCCPQRGVLNRWKLRRKKAEMKAKHVRIPRLWKRK